MQVGERWGYREPPHTPGKALSPVDILQFGPPKSRKVRVRLIDGEYEGLDRWVSGDRLRVRWEDADAFLDDERRYHAARFASRHAERLLEFRAACAVIGCDPYPDSILFGWSGKEAGTVEIADLDLVCRFLGEHREELLAEPLAFIDRHGVYVGPWPIALRLAKRTAVVFPDLVLDYIRQEERQLQDLATNGKYVQAPHSTYERFIPPERYAPDLHEAEPVFALVREWCGVEKASTFAEAEALRAEVERLRGLVLEAANWLKRAGHPVIASRMLRDIGIAPEPSAKRRSKA